MPNYDDLKGTFLNRRDWNTYLSKLQIAVSYPKMMEAFKSSPAWFTLEAPHASDWLVGSGELGSKLAP